MYRPTTAMVKFFTQCCPRCEANAEPSKCLSIIKGQIVPTREFSEDKKDPKSTSDPLKESDPAFSSSQKANEAAQFEEKAKKALEELKRQTEKEDKPKK